MNSEIVVGIDGSPASVAALGWAVRHARDIGGRVRAVSVCRIHPRQPGRRNGTDAFRAMHERFLRTAVDQVASDAAGVRIDESVPDGSPGPVLAELSEHAATLVLGGHGYRKAGIAVVGSVISYCLRHAACPVVVVPSGGAADDRDRSRVPRAAQEFR